MTIGDMKVYDQEIYSAAIEILGQDINKFNAASGGAILLSMEGFRGDFSKEAFYASIASAKRRVDRYAAQGTITPTVLSQKEVVGVKVAGGFGPIEWEPSQLSYLKRNPGEAVNNIATGFANALLADQLNTSIAAAVAAIENIAALVNDVSASGAITQNAINRSHSKFGDNSMAIVADVITGDIYHRLVDQGLDNSNRLFEAGNVTIVSILNKVIVVTDAPALKATGTPNVDKVLSLVAGGIVVDNVSDIITNLESSNGQTRIENTWQADYTFGVNLKGFAWDTANGGASPTDVELTTGTNWDSAMTDNKHLAGTLAIGSSDVTY